jgi:hypothetical protein
MNLTESVRVRVGDGETNLHIANAQSPHRGSETHDIGDGVATDGTAT